MIIKKKNIFIVSSLIAFCIGFLIIAQHSKSIPIHENTITDYIYIDIDTVKPNTTIELGKTRTNELALNAIKMKTTELAFNVITTYSNMKITVSRIIYNNNGLKTAVDYGYYIMLLLKSYILG